MNLIFRSKMAQQVLQPELKKNGVQFHLRKLHVGDFLWIAKPKFGKKHISLSLTVSICTVGFKFSHYRGLGRHQFTWRATCKFPLVAMLICT